MSQINRDIIAGINASVLGNSERGLKELCSDLIAARGGKKACSTIADEAYLSSVTVARVLECDAKYKPQADTLERIMRVCNVRLSTGYIASKGKYSPKPKE